MSIELGARLATHQLRARTPYVAAAVGAAAVILGAALEAAREPAYAVDRALLGIASGVVLPLFCYSLFETVHRRETSLALVSPLARYGANRRSLAVGVFALLAAGTALAGSIFAGLAVIGARSGGDSGLFAELFASAWGGACAGLGYSGVFAFASRWGRSGRLWTLAGDWLLGSGASFLALPWPRAHARNLLGGEPVLDLPQAVSALLLLTLAAVGPLLMSRRLPP
jgi:hypothetical protein